MGLWVRKFHSLAILWLVGENFHSPATRKGLGEKKQENSHRTYVKPCKFLAPVRKQAKKCENVPEIFTQGTKKLVWVKARFSPKPTRS